MTDSMHLDDSNLHNDQGSLDINSGLLTLVGNNPVHIYVKAILQRGVIPAFALDKHGTWYTGGIAWASDGEFGKFIKFEFMKSVTGVDCDELPYSAVFGSHQQHQDLCLLAVAPATYDFTVSFAGAPARDPKIIVTPVNPDPNG
jgi:hypothetical protein